jgi:hypothetical protein
MMIKDSYVGCQYRYLWRKLHRESTEQLSLGKEAPQQLKTWRSHPTLYIRLRTANCVGNTFMLVCVSENHNVHL